MKTLKIVLIIILCGIMLFLGGFLAFALKTDWQGWNITPNGLTGNYELVLNEEVSAEGINSLSVQYGMNSNDVFFFEGTEDKIVIKEYLNFTPEENEISTIQNKDGELVVKGKKRDGFFAFGFYGGRDGYVEIYLPSGFAGNLSVATVSGDIRTERDFVQMGQLRLSSTSGDIAFTKIEADSVRISTVSGEIRAEELTGNADLSTTSGDIRLEQTKGDLSVSTTSGEITIANRNGKLNADTTSGDIRVDVADGAFSINTVSGEVTVGDGCGFGTVGTTSGDIRVFLKELQGDFSVSTVSGEVSLALPSDAAFDFSFHSVSGECNTFFDDELSFNKKGTDADGTHGSGSNLPKVKISGTSGDLRITEYQQ